jgi:signal transduction histidine kinase
VANRVGPEATGEVAGGHGIDGMRRRLESVGGRLDIRTDPGPDAETFTATARIPLRRVAG